MEICLFHTEGDYLTALEAACLNLDFPSMRLRLFSEKSLWMAAIQRPDYWGVAAGPRQGLEEAGHWGKKNLLLLTAMHDPPVPEEIEAVSILDGLDALVGACTRVLEQCGRSEAREGMYIVFSMGGWLQQHAAFERLKTHLRAHRPSDCLLDGTSLGSLLKEVKVAVTHWLWDEQASGFQKGGIYSLYEDLQDRDAVGSKTLESSLVSAALKFNGCLWIWCGLEWPGFINKLISEAKGVLWLCDHPADEALAEAWTVQLKKRHNGLESVFISDFDSGGQGSRFCGSPFDACFNSLEAFLSAEKAGRR